SVATFNVIGNTTYYIAFDNFWTSNGFTFQLLENDVVVPPVAPITFSAVNIGTINSTYNECVVDMNNDYLDDIVGVSSNNIKVHRQNTDGTFTVFNYPTTNAQFQPSWSIAAGDYNKDGYNDLMYGGGSGATFMRSNGTGTTFTQDSPGQYIFCQRTNFIDINNDGNLDAFSCHDVDPNVYYLNNGTGNFTYYQSGTTAGAVSLGVSPNGGNYGSIWIDYNNDHHQDLFIAKCGSVPPDELHRNNGNGTFSDISTQVNLYDAGQSWSSAWADFDNDGDMDVFVGASSGAHKLKKNNLDLTNTVEEPFTDITAGSGFDNNVANSIEHVAYDFDNDGLVDILGGGNKIMFNLGNMVFAPVSYANLSVGSIGDFNNDGFLDIQNGQALKMNSGNDNNWIKINLQGIASNSNGIGSRVELHGPWGVQIRDVRSGEGFAHMSSLNVHFGIGTATEITQVVIYWPSGTVDVIQNPAINDGLFVVEGSSPLGVGSASAIQFSVYPNPAKDFITFSFDLTQVEIKSANIYDLSGKLVHTTTKISDSQIDVRTLSTGTYILVLKDVEGRNYTQKFIRN
ncbi:MAG TPA: FG-GAP-like repeat-containing protein, partial [Flavobacterium sp.]|nr:FG-GAP-like repeat-containing protein [Flavobacterium sp.]